MNKRHLTKSLYTEEWEVFLKLLKDVREKRGWTQAQLAQKLGRAQSVVAKIEAGERKLDICQFVDYMKILEADPVAMMRRFMKALQKP